MISLVCRPLIQNNNQPSCLSLQGCSVRLPNVHFVHEEISAACSFNKHCSGCLHEAICEAGVQGSFHFVSHIQTEGGITSVLPAPEKRPAEPTGLFNTGSTPPTHLYAAEWTEIRGWGYWADQIWKCGRRAEAVRWGDEAEQWVTGRGEGVHCGGRKPEWE